MKPNSKLLGRRKILKVAFFGAAAAVFPLKRIIPFSASASNAGGERVGYYVKEEHKRLRETALKYGGEFAEVKPEIRRDDNGCV